MLEFLQNYGAWILFGAMFLFMMRAHGLGGHAGGGCGMGGEQHSMHPEEEKGSGEKPRTMDSNRRKEQHRPMLSEEESGGKKPRTVDANRHSGCH